MKISGSSKLTLFFLLFFSLSFPAIGGQKEKKTDVPFHVTSDQMIAVRGKSMVEFIGNVRATRQDSIVIADSIKIFFTKNNNKKGSSSENNIKQIISTGNVQYTAGDKKAYADKAVYTTLDETLVLTGKTTKLITGTSFVTGKKITLYQKQDKVIVESDSTNRVEALFNPENKDKTPDK